jgi:STE24 endopeptidase
MQLAQILAVVLALVLSEGAPHEPVGAAGPRLALALVVMALAPVLAAVGTSWTVRGIRRDFEGRHRHLSRFDRLRRAHVCVFLLAVVGVYYGLDWGQLVRFDAHLNGLPLIDDLVVLAPILLPLVLSWLLFYEVDRALRVELADRHGLSFEPTSRWSYLDNQFRFGLGLVLIPLLIMLGAQDVLAITGLSRLLGHYAAVLLLIPLSAVTIGFPLVLKQLWRARPLECGPLRTALLETAAAWGVRVRDILVWPSQRTTVNAAVAGFVPWCRYVFLSDGLVDRLSPVEIAAVFGHEAGHIRRRHLLRRGLVLLAPVVLGIGIVGAWPSLESIALDKLARWGITPEQQFGLLGLALMAAYSITVFRWISHRFEHEADLLGCEAVAAEPRMTAERNGCPDLTDSGVAAMKSALLRLAELNGVDPNARGWQHPSIRARVRFLEAMADPLARHRFLRANARINRAVLSGFAAGVVICLFAAAA